MSARLPRSSVPRSCATPNATAACRSAEFDEFDASFLRLAGRCAAEKLILARTPPAIRGSSARGSLAPADAAGGVATEPRGRCHHEAARWTRVR
jgi:hypothetical protein